MSHESIRSNTIVNTSSNLRPLQNQVTTFDRKSNFTLEKFTYGRTEDSACESLIFPVLREVWKTYHKDLSLFSHEPIRFDSDLSGTPDYIVTRCSPLSPFFPEIPYVLIVVEAKRDDFQWGWGQCLAAMLAAQKLAIQPHQVVYGISTTGQIWEFGKLKDDQLVVEPVPFVISKLDQVFDNVHSLFADCRKQVLSLTSTLEPIA